MPRLLIVHHTPSPAVQAMFEAVVAGTTTDEIEGVEVVRRPALAATASDALAADGFVLGTPANLGMMSGALKVFFDTTGAVRGIESVTTGLGWEKVTPVVSVTGEPGKADLRACWELGATVAASLMN